jgi:hypothetical protein
MLDVAGPMQLQIMLSGIDKLPGHRRAEVEAKFEAMGRPLDGLRDMLKKNPPLPPGTKREWKS